MQGSEVQSLNIVLEHFSATQSLATAISYNHVTADVIRGDRTKEDASTSQPDCRMKKDKGGGGWGELTGPTSPGCFWRNSRLQRASFAMWLDTALME